MFSIILYDNIVRQQKTNIITTIEKIEIEKNLSEQWRCKVVLPSNIDIQADNMLEVIETIEKDGAYTDIVIFSGYITNIRPSFSDLNIIEVSAKDMNAKANDIWVLTNWEFTEKISEIMARILNARETTTWEVYTFFIDEDLDITITEELKSWVKIKTMLDDLSQRLNCFWDITRDRQIALKKIIGEDKRLIFTARDDDDVRDDNEIRYEWPDNPILLQYDAFNPTTNNITNVDREISWVSANIVLWVGDTKELEKDMVSIEMFSGRLEVYRETWWDIEAKTQARLDFAKKTQAVLKIDVYQNLDLEVGDYVTYTIANTNKYLDGSGQVYVANKKTVIQNGEKINTIWLSEDIVKEYWLIEKIRNLDKTLQISIL